MLWKKTRSSRGESFISAGREWCRKMRSNRAPWLTDFSEINCDLFSYERSFSRSWRCEPYKVSPGLHLAKSEPEMKGYVHAVGLSHRGGTLNGRNPDLLEWADSQSAETLLDRETRSLSSEAAHGTTPLSGQSGQKLSVPMLAGCAEIRERLMEHCSRSKSLIGTLLFCLKSSLFCKLVKERFSLCFIARVSPWCFSVCTRLRLC